MSLVELLVVIAVIGVIIALLLPAVQSARAAARRMACMNNARQQAVATLNYASAHNEKLPATWRTSDVDPWNNFSWRTTLLPYLEEQSVYDKLDLARSPVENPNRAVIVQPVPTYECPSTPKSPRQITLLGREGVEMIEVSAAAHDFVAVYAVHSRQRGFPFRGVWHGGPAFSQFATHGGDVRLGHAAAEERTKPGSLKFVKDGLSKTALIVEQAGKPFGMGTYTEATAHSPSEGAWATCDVGFFFGLDVNSHNFRNPFGFHRGAILALCDGSVTLLHESTHREVVTAILSRDGNEILSEGDWLTRGP